MNKVDRYKLEYMYLSCS